MKKALFFIVCLCFAINMMAQTKTITGVVVDATGEPVIGASVLEVGTTNGTITDVDGNFTIQVPVGAKLDVSYIGYKTQQIVVGVPNTYKVILKEDARTKFGGPNTMQPAVIEWENKISNADHSDSKVVLPLVLYLSTARLWKDGNKKTNIKGVFSRTDAYNHCLDSQHGLEIAFRYIETLKAVSLEENGGKLFPAYEAILKAVNEAFCDELKPGEEIISSTKYEDDIIALKTVDGTILPFQMLSDGYRNVIKIMLDIATRMCILNPYLKGDALKMTPGIVIIDEIDLSLHPTWQKRIIGILKEQFPRIQFICATHSPFIIQSLDEGELITLDQPLDSEYSGEGLEDIAEDVMGVEMPQYSERKRKIYEAASKYYTALKEAKTQDDIARLGKELADLEAEYSDNPAYMAWVHQKYTEQAWKVKKNETSR